MQKKRHSILGIASCAIFVIWVGFFFFIYQPVFGSTRYIDALSALILFGTLLGVLSFLEPNSKKAFGCIGLIANIAPLLCVGVYALLSYFRNGW